MGSRRTRNDAPTAGGDDALRRSEERYRATIDALDEFIHVVGEDLRFVLVNRSGRAWMRRFGLPPDLEGRAIFEVFPFLDPRVREEYRRVFAGEGTLVTRERHTVAGQEVETETRKIPIVEGARVVGVVTVIRDVTEEVRTQERLRQSDKLAALHRLAGGVAHDFNNQLTAILGFAQILQRRLADPELREYAETIGRQAGRSADLTRQLLAFARRGRAGSQEVDVHVLLRETAAVLARTLDPRIALRLRLEASQARTVGDGSQLQSAFLNLALNARDAMPEGGELELRTDLLNLTAAEARTWREGLGSGRYLRVQVRDDGVGMSDAVQRRLFEPFFTTKPLGAGSGMGLAVVHGTVLHHRGAVRVHSAPGRGSLFSVLLPLAPGPARRASPTAPEPPPSGGGHVLLADDQPAVREVAVRLFAELGYRVTACEDGAEALRRFGEARGAFDLVILDVMMPVLGGTAALEAMRRIDPSVRAILCSGHPPGPAEERLLGAGRVGFLEKPFGLRELAHCVARLQPAPPGSGKRRKSGRAAPKRDGVRPGRK